MSKVSPQRRRFKIRKKQKRQKKLKKLRELYQRAKSKAVKDKILEKVSKIVPCLTEEEFLAPLEKRK